ncbi:MAG: CDP-alcohol phosphatidyltransferase family protein [Candidatus Aureabacteria bacterium]|nr:CDP-alcohol phosphatidyltransferase family protein [Candidatus Auribacterota bacterium]
MNLPNRLTIFRMMLVPVFLAFMVKFKNSADYRYLLASLLVFTFAAATDALDGLLARLRNQKTELGALLDPLADKFLLSSAAILLSLRLPLPVILPSWYAILVISRDIFILTGISIITMLKKEIIIRPSFLSKITTFLQMVTIIWIMLLLPKPHILWYISALFTFVSAIGYLIEGSRKIHVA